VEGCVWPVLPQQERKRPDAGESHSEAEQMCRGSIRSAALQVDLGRVRPNDWEYPVHGRVAPCHGGGKTSAETEH
jgi:hypothetical protein